MKRSLYAFLFLNILTVFVSSADASTSGNNNCFLGLWQGVDNLDGSVTLLSISDADNNGVMTVRLTDSFFSHCKDAGYSTSPGLVDGTATIQNKILSWESSFKCYDPATNKLVEIKKDTVKFEFNTKEDILIDGEGEIYHHISNH